MRFVDTFLFSEPHEADVLWVKLNVEDHLFHEWVVVENSYTHQGQYKGHFLNDLIRDDERFARFIPKLHVIESDIKPDFPVGDGRVSDDEGMRLESAQREAALPHLLATYADEDRVLVSDVDECLDTEAPKRRRLLRSKVAAGGDVVLVPRIRYVFDFDNRRLGRGSVSLVSIRQLKRDGHLNHYRRALGNPSVIWKHEMVFEYSYCYRRDSILRKYETMWHVGFGQADLDVALRHNHRHVSEHRVAEYGSRPLDWTAETWFVKRRPNARNSPAFVREHLAELKTGVVSPHYKRNRMETYPQFFPKSPVRRARNWAVLYGRMYADLGAHVVHSSRPYRLLPRGQKVLSALRRPGRSARMMRYLRRRVKSREHHSEEVQGSRASSVEYLVEDLRGLTTSALPSEPPVPSAPRVLLFTGHGMWSRATPLVDGVLFHALRQRGAECTAVLCGAALPACHIELVNTHPPEELLASGRPRICDTCVDQGSRIHDALGVPFRTMSGVLEADDDRRAKEIVSRIPYEEFFEYRDGGVPVGAHARSSIMRYLLSGRLSDNAIDRAVAERFMVSSLLVLESARRLIKELEPDVIVANHGIYMMAGIFGDVARAQGARTVAWNKGYRKDTLVFAHGTSHHYEMMDEPTSTWDQRQLTTEERDRLREYLLVSRSRQSIDFWMNYQPRPITDRDVLIRTLGLDPSRSIVALFTNVNWDAQIAYPHNAFPDQLSWLIKTIEHFRKRPEVQLVIRVHPAEAKGLNVSRQRMADEIRAAVPDLPENVHVIPAESDLSSYTLAELIDGGIVFASKFGIEMAVRGIPVVVAGNAWIRGKGFSHDASSPEEYDRILGEIERLPRMSPELVERAYMYANHFLFRRSIPVPVELGDPRQDTATVDLRSLDELLPGRNRAMDVICSGILEGTPFVVDEPPAEHRADPISSATST